MRRRLYTGKNTGSIPEVVCVIKLVVPVGDPDVFFLREENCKLTAEQKRLLATVNALLGNVFLTSDMPSHYTDTQREEYRRLRALFEQEEKIPFDQVMKMINNMQTS